MPASISTSPHRADAHEQTQSNELGATTMTMNESRISRGEGLAAHLRRAICWAEAIPLGLPQLLARLGVGAVFFRSGLTKLDSWPTTVMLFKEEYRVPVLPADIAAYVATGFELACPVFLVLGLATRLAALPLIGMTIIIQLFVYPTSWVDHTMWAALLTLLIARGAGPVSIDWLIARGAGRGA